MIRILGILTELPQGISRFQIVVISFGLFWAVVLAVMTFTAEPTGQSMVEKAIAKLRSAFRLI